MSHVLIIFQANTEPVEQMALAVAVGAVEAEGLIRLRRLAGEGAPEVGHKSYGQLQVADLSWATTIIVGLEDPSAGLDESDTLLNLLSQIQLLGVSAWTFSAEGLQTPRTAAQTAVEKAFIDAGIALLKLEIHEGLAELLEQMKQAGRLSVRYVENS